MAAVLLATLLLAALVVSCTLRMPSAVPIPTLTPASASVETAVVVRELILVATPTHTDTVIAQESQPFLTARSGLQPSFTPTPNPQPQEASKAIPIELGPERKISIAGKELAVPEEIWVGAVLQEVLCTQKDPCPRDELPVFEFRKGDLFLWVSAVTGNLHAGSMAWEDNAYFLFLNEVLTYRLPGAPPEPPREPASPPPPPPPEASDSEEALSETLIRIETVQFGTKVMRLPSDVEFLGVEEDYLCVEGIPCLADKAPFLIFQKGDSRIVVSQLTGEIVNEIIGPGEEGAFASFKQVLWELE